MTVRCDLHSDCVLHNGHLGRCKRRCDRWPYCGKEENHDGNCALKPQPGFQEAFLAATEDVVIGGGAAGAGKTATLLMVPLLHIEDPGFTALILRKEQKDLEQPGGVWPESHKIYPAFGGVPNVGKYQWRFPSGAIVQFGYVNPRTYKQDYHGSAAAALLFDELTHFTLDEFRYLRARNRPAGGCRVRAFCRATCNPDRDSWVRTFIGWWLGEENGRKTGTVHALPERSGKVRYLVGRSGSFYWGTKEELSVQFPRTKPDNFQSVTFLPGTLSENVFLGDDYREKVLGMEEHLAAAWLDSDWNAGKTEGRVFHPEWFPDSADPDKSAFVASPPPGTKWVRAWDLAATAERDATSANSYTAGILLGRHGDRYYVGDAIIGRWDSADVQMRVLEAAKDDGVKVKIWFCREKAGAGKAQLQDYVRLLKGFEVDGEPESGSKETRLGPVAAQAKFGNLRIVRGHWNDQFLKHLLRLPDRPDDVGDALAAAFQVLTGDNAPTLEQVRQDVKQAQGFAQRVGKALDSGFGRGGGGFRDPGWGDGGRW